MSTLPWDFSIDRARRELAEFTLLAIRTKSEIVETMAAAEAAKTASLTVIAEANRLLMRR